MITTILLGLSCIGVFFLFLFAKKAYSAECLTISKSEYKQRYIIPVGLLLLDLFPGLQNKQVNYSLLQLYGKQQYLWRKRMFEAERIALVIFFFFLSTSIIFFLNLKSLTVKSLDEVEKSSFGEGDKAYHYYYDLKIPGGNNKSQKTEAITFIVPQMEPSKEEIKIELERIKKELPTIILSENKSLDHIDHPLYLPKSLSDRVQIIWTSNRDTLLQNNGQIRYNNLQKEGEKVILKAKIDCYGVEGFVQYDLKLYKKSLSAQEKKEQLDERIKLMLSHQALMNISNQRIDLPKIFHDYDTTVSWYDGQRIVTTLRLMLLGIGISILFYFLKCHELKINVNKRQEALLKEFPGFVNKFALLMNAGMTFTRAWEKIATDYIKLKDTSGELVLLYEEMLLTIEDLQKGVTELKAYEAFGQRCKIPEILRFTAIVMQNIKKGSDLLIGAMQQQAKEAMSMREDLARKKGEKASTKLVLPMGIMFIAILIIVITPALITLKI